MADPAWRSIELLSDVHLHTAMPRTFDAWRRHLHDTDADALLILGDLFEVWVGDDARIEPFERHCAQVLREAASKRPTAFLAGNRDFLVGRDLLDECGVQQLADPTLLVAFGRRWLLTHGDELCVADVAYQQFRAEVRSAAWQQRFLALPLAERQLKARAMRDASQAHQAGRGPEQWADVDDAAACDWIARSGADAMIHGHTHRPATHALPCGKPRHVLGDWDFDGTRPRARILRLDANGLHDIDLAA